LHPEPVEASGAPTSVFCLEVQPDPGRRQCNVVSWSIQTALDATLPTGYHHFVDHYSHFSFEQPISRSLRISITLQANLSSAASPMTCAYPLQPSTMNRVLNLASGIRRPFDNQTRHVPEFSIQLDDAYRMYGPGDSVVGTVALTVMRAIDITHLVVCLHGFAQAYKTANTPGEEYRAYNAALVAGRTEKAGGYYGKGFISLFEDEVVLCAEGRMSPHRYNLGFELTFPTGKYPSSIDVCLISGDMRFTR
jgi:hypothetical protein